MLDPIRRQRLERRIALLFMAGLLVLGALIQWCAPDGATFSAEQETPVSRMEPAP